MTIGWARECVVRTRIYRFKQPHAAYRPMTRIQHWRIHPEERPKRRYQNETLERFSDTTVHRFDEQQ
jgi:hypothetical protein